MVDTLERSLNRLIPRYDVRDINFHWLKWSHHALAGNSQAIMLVLFEVDVS